MNEEESAIGANSKYQVTLIKHTSNNKEKILKYTDI